MLKNDTLNTKQTTSFLNRKRCNISEISHLKIFTLMLRFYKRAPDDGRYRSKHEVM